MPISPTIWGRDPHTGAKHAILAEYLKAWLPILASGYPELIFIDAFAGPGEYAGGEKGSPLIALEIAIDYQARVSSTVRFIFIESHPKRFQNLESNLRSYIDRVGKNIKAHILKASFAEAIHQILDKSHEDTPAFAFLDPFGYSQIPMAAIQDFARHPKKEVLITFMYEEINRFLSVEHQQCHFDALFGTTTWRKILQDRDPDVRNRKLHDLYWEQLRCHAGLEYVRSFEMVNEGNRTDYFLFYGTNHIKGMEVMKNAMWKVDPTGQYRFSDLSVGGQRCLFDLEPSPQDIANEILPLLQGKEFRVEPELYEMILANTRFRWGGIKKGVLPYLEKTGRLHASGPRKRACTYPLGTKVRFTRAKNP